MVTKHQIKLIKSLGQKKYRHQEGLFVVEGIKGIAEFLNSPIELDHLFATEVLFDVEDGNYSIISDKDLNRISFLKNPNKALAIFKIPTTQRINTSGLSVVLDDIRDPGNLGTIIRLCDWFGIKQIICSPNSVDCYNPKVVQASMGSLARIKIDYRDLSEFIKSSDLPVYGTFMHGDDIYASDLSKEGLIIFGNEANGISNSISDLVDKRITIPQFGDIKNTESLNVANATAIVLSEFCRKTIEK